MNLERAGGVQILKGKTLKVLFWIWALMAGPYGKVERIQRRNNIIKVLNLNGFNNIIKIEFTMQA
jgi:hypothetical protein